MNYFVSTINTYYVELSDMIVKACPSDEFIVNTTYNTIIIKLRQK